MTKHELKTIVGVFDKVVEGVKTFEVRKDDRHYETGDLVKLQEYHPRDGYTGRETGWLEIVYILPGGQFGIEVGYIVMQLKPATL